MDAAAVSYPGFEADLGSLLDGSPLATAARAGADAAHTLPPW